jgi:tetratricopeptide (TPR) repeat protein
VALDPTEPATHLYRAWHFRCRGQIEEALQEMRTAQRLDPLSRIINARVGTVLQELGRYSESESVLREAIDLDPGNDAAKGELVATLIFERRYEEAIRASPADTSDAVPFNLTSGLGYAYARAGHRAEAVAILQRLERRARKHYVTPEALAIVALGAGDTTQALDWLEQGYRQHSFYLWEIGTDPPFFSLRQNPRFRRVVDGMGLILPPIPRRS